MFSTDVITPDGVFYVNLAKMIKAGDYQRMSRDGFFNLYPFLIVFAQKVFFNWETAGRMVSVVSGSIAVVPLFFIFKRLINVKIALIAVILYIISPRLVQYSADVLRESSFWCFSLIAIWLALTGIFSQKWFYVVFASLFSALSVLLRIEGVSVMIIILLWFCWYYHTGILNRKRFTVNVIVFIVSAPLIFSPALLLVKHTLGEWNLGLAGTKIPYLITHDANKTFNEHTDIIKETSEQFQSFIEISERHRYITFVVETFYKFSRSFNVVFVFLLLFGLFLRRSTPYSKNEIPFLIWFAVSFFTSFAYLAKTYYISTRHGLIMVFPALVWAGIGFYEFRDFLFNRLKKNIIMQRYAQHLTFFLFVVLISVMLPQTLSTSKDKVELKRAGLYLKKMGYSSTRFSGDPRLIRTVFYADSEFVYIPDKLSLDDVSRFISNNNIKYIIIDKRITQTVPDSIKEMLNSKMFEKISLPQLDTFREYSISVYKMNHRQDKQFENRRQLENNS
jgi:hypothetical protein